MSEKHRTRSCGEEAFIILEVILLVSGLFLVGFIVAVSIKHGRKVIPCAHPNFLNNNTNCVEAEVCGKMEEF